MAKKRYVTGAAAACVHVTVAEPRGDAPPAPDLPLEPEPCSAAAPCCDRRDEYNGYGSGPRLFTCPRHCGCHD